MYSERAWIAALGLLTGCFAEAPGVAIGVVVRASEVGLTRDGEQLTLHNDLGVPWSISHGWIAVTHAALEPCPEPSQVDAARSTTEAPSDAGELTALTDDLDAVVVPLDQRASGPVPLGTLRPSPGHFCAITLQYGPVGSLDDTGIPDGTWTLDLTTGDSGLRHLHDAGRHLATAPLDPPLVVSPRHRDATVSLSLPLASWLDGLREADDDDTMVATIDQHLSTSPTVVFE